MNTSIYFQSGLPVLSGYRTDDAVVVDFEGYDTYKFSRNGWYHRTASYMYNEACRFLRLIERGYSPDKALDLSAYPDKYQWDYKMVASLHDKLSDEIPPFVPFGFSIVETHVEELATCEIEALVREWRLDGDEALFVASENYGVPFLELRAFVTGMAQHDDEEGSWSISHHTSNYAY